MLHTLSSLEGPQHIWHILVRREGRGYKKTLAPVYLPKVIGKLECQSSASEHITRSLMRGTTTIVRIDLPNWVRGASMSPGVCWHNWASRSWRSPINGCVCPLSCVQLLCSIKSKMLAELIILREGEQPAHLIISRVR